MAKIWAVIFIILVSTVRLINLESTPVFGDEAVYCWAGYEITTVGLPKTWQMIVNQKKFAPLLSVIHGGLMMVFPKFSPIFLCRSVSVIASGLVGLILFMWLKNWVALVFWLVNPFNFFNDRTSLQEPLLNLLIVATMVSLERERSIKAGVFLVLSFLTKLTTLLVVPGLVGLALVRKRVVQASVLILAVLIFKWWAIKFTNLWDIFGYHAYADWSLITLSARVLKNLRLTISWYQQYLTGGFWVLAILGIWQSLRQQQGQWLMLLVSILAGYILLADSYFPRLLLVTLPLWAIILSYSAKMKVGWLTFGILLLVWIKNDLNIVWQPRLAKIAKEDYWQFYQDWTSGETIRQAVLRWQNQPDLKQVKVSRDTAAMWQLYKLRLAPERQIEIIIE